MFPRRLHIGLAMPITVTCRMIINCRSRLVICGVAPLPVCMTCGQDYGAFDKALVLNLLVLAVEDGGGGRRFAVEEIPSTRFCFIL